MAKKLIFTFVWMVVGFVAVSLLAGLLTSLLKKVGGMDEHTLSSVKFAYADFALLPFVVIGACLLLGLFGKLPGTKISEQK